MDFQVQHTFLVLTSLDVTCGYVPGWEPEFPYDRTGSCNPGSGCRCSLRCCFRSFRGKVDAVMQRIIEVLVGIPSLIIVILS